MVETHLNDHLNTSYRELLDEHFLKLPAMFLRVSAWILWPLQGEMGINFLFDFASCRGVSREWHWVAEAMLQEGAEAQHPG